MARPIGPGRGRPSWLWSNLPLPEPHLVALALGAVLHRQRPWELRVRAYLRLVVGWSLVAAGVSVVAASWTAAGRTDLEQPDRLIVRGPYAHSRNPMYLGWAALHLGTSLIAGSGWMLAGLPAAVAVIHRQVLHEEDALADTFGEAFESYRAAVPRYVRGWRSVSRSRLSPSSQSRGVRLGVQVSEPRPGN